VHLNNVKSDYIAQSNTRPLRQKSTIHRKGNANAGIFLTQQMGGKEFATLLLVVYLVECCPSMWREKIVDACAQDDASKH